MAFTTPENDAIARLAAYNGNPYDAVTNPYGLAGLGYRANPDTGFPGNWDNTTDDMALVANAIMREGTAAVATAMAMAINAANANSDTSFTLAKTSKDFHVTVDIPTVAPFLVQTWVLGYSQADSTKQFVGQLTGINATTETLTVNVTSIRGTGSASDWKIVTVGQPGPDPNYDYSALTAFTGTLDDADVFGINDVSASTVRKLTLTLLYGYIKAKLDTDYNVLDFVTKTGSYTVAAADAKTGRRVLRYDATSGTQDFTIPTDDQAAISVGSVVNFRKGSAGVATARLIAGSSMIGGVTTTVTLHSPTGATNVLDVYGYASAIKVGANEWDIAGDV